MLGDSLSGIVGINVIEADIICAKYNVQFGRGFLSSNINNTCSSQEQIGVRTERKGIVLIPLTTKNTII